MSCQHRSVVQYIEKETGMGITRWKCGDCGDRMWIGEVLQLRYQGIIPMIEGQKVVVVTTPKKKKKKRKSGADMF